MSAAATLEASLMVLQLLSIYQDIVLGAYYLTYDKPGTESETPTRL